MEILKRLKIKNFLGTKDREIDFTLYDNPIFIVWENAWWKTTIMRAIYMALTGEDAFFNSKKLDWLINDYADNMSIELELLNKWNLYKITISKQKWKPLDIMIYENDKQLIMSSLNKEAKGQLVKLFGNPVAILSTYFIFGDNKNDFVDTTPSERLKIITKVSNAFQKYEKISEKAKWFVKKYELEKNKSIGQLELANRNVEELELKVKDFNLDDENNKKIIIEKEIKKLRDISWVLKQIQDIDKELSLVDNINIEDIVKKLKENKDNIKNNESVKNEITDIETKISSNNKILNEFNIKEASLKWELDSNSKEIKTNKWFLKDISKFNDTKFDELELNIIEEKINNGKNVIEDKLELGRKIKTDIEIKESDVSKIKIELDKKNKELTDTTELFNHNTECPLCHNSLKLESLDNYKEFIKKEVIDLKEKIEKENVTINDLKVKKDKILWEWKQYTEILNILETVLEKKKIIIENDKINKIINDLNNKKIDIEDKYKENNVIILKEQSKIKELNNIIDKLKLKLKNILTNSEIEKLENILDINKKISILQENKIKLQKNISDEFLNKTYNEIVNDMSVTESNLDNINSKIVSHKNDLERIKLDKKKQSEIKWIIEFKNKDIEEYENIQKLFGKDWIQKRQIQLLLGQIEMETNGLVKKFFENISVKFDYSKKWIDLKILRRVDLNNGWFQMKEDVIGNFSDAQQEVLKVLLKISFSKVVQNLNNTPLNILFLNETFNTLSVDKEPLLVEILSYYSKFYHIGFITHNQELIENYKQDNVYHIK